MKDAGHAGGPGRAYYSNLTLFDRTFFFSSAGLHGMDLIRINTLCPGFVQTPLVQSTLGPEQSKVIEAMRERTVMKAGSSTP